MVKNKKLKSRRTKKSTAYSKQELFRENSRNQYKKFSPTNTKKQGILGLGRNKMMELDPLILDRLLAKAGITRQNVKEILASFEEQLDFENDTMDNLIDLFLDELIKRLVENSEN